MHRSRPVLAAVLAVATLGACSGGADAPAASDSPARTAPASTTPSSTSATPIVPAPSSTSRSAPPSRTAPSSTPRTHVAHALPLSGTTGNADQVITVVAPSHASTTAQLQAWTRAAGGWTEYGPSMTAHLGSGGIGRASEGSTRTPAGSFTLTQAFGHDGNPGSRLPYVHTTKDDWWISQSSSPLYNTRQRCASRCSFTRGDPNEHLYYETPYYNYAVVIDYNTRNAPGGVEPGAGSAFFLHVTDGGPTAGCVSIPEDRLVSILRWLRPGRHPRILIGVDS